MSGRRRGGCEGRVDTLVAENVIDILKIEFGFGLRTLPQVLDRDGEQCGNCGRE